MILGIDEAGRGAWAGPLAVGGAIILDSTHPVMLTLRDSKQLSKQARQTAMNDLRNCSVFHVVLISSTEVDQWGLTMATKTAILRLLSTFQDYAISKIIIDGNTAFLSGSSISADVVYRVKADSIYPEVMAASIAAKVQRDTHMIELSKKPQYKSYGFDKHVGYGTKNHIAALNKHGVSDQHRSSYAPIQRLLSL